MRIPYQVDAPIKRSKLRKLIGKEFFILKRKINWLLHSKSFARPDPNLQCPYSFIKHQTILLRRLKDVDMYLQHNKITNLRLAIATLNNVVIKPGETLSLWKLIGRPTKAKGYLDGLTLENGEISKGTGGGLCQLGNLIYWMTLHTPLTVKERWRHGYDVFPDTNRTIPFACGATLSYNYIDLQIENKTDKNFRLLLWIDDTYLNGEILCSESPVCRYEVFESDHLFKHQWWGGYTRHNKIWRRIIQLSNNKATQELVSENNAIMMYNPLIGKTQEDRKEN